MKDAVSLDPFDSGDLTWGDYNAVPDVPDVPEPTQEKRGRGRPKGSKNKPGHKAGRPRKSGELGDEDEDDAGQEASSESNSNAKRARTGESLEANHLVGLHSDGQHQMHLPQHSIPLHIPQLHHHDSHALAGDIPVDPSLMAGPSRNIDLGRYSQPDYGLSISVSAAPSTIADTASAAIAYFARETPSSPAVIPHPPIHRQPDPPPPPPPTQHHQHFHLHSSHQLSAHETALNSLSGALSTKPDVKGKGVLHTSVTPVAAEVGVSGVIRNLLPKDLLGSLPQVSGPFQLVETEDRKRKLDGPLAASSLERQPGPVYVYIANYQPSESSGAPAFTPPVPGGIPVGLASWKITHPLTSEGKDRVRGPRKCGHCGKYECRGRGGRTWCPDFQAGLPSVAPSKRQRSSTAGVGKAKGEEVDNSDDDSDADGSSAGGTQSSSHYPSHSSATDASYSALANFRGDVNHASTSGAHNALANSSNQLYQNSISVNGTDAEVHESVLSLIQSILPQATDENGRTFAAEFIASTTGFSGGPYGGSSNMDLYGHNPSEPEHTSSSVAGGSSVAGASPKKPRGPRHCSTCHKSDCPGKALRSRCKEWTGTT
ncbi:hypothetical protein RQP46_009425 [Phenoliferia psychrophenolica]